MTASLSEMLIVKFEVPDGRVVIGMGDGDSFSDCFSGSFVDSFGECFGNCLGGCFGGCFGDCFSDCFGDSFGDCVGDLFLLLRCVSDRMVLLFMIGCRLTRLIIGDGECDVRRWVEQPSNFNSPPLPTVDTGCEDRLETKVGPYT